MVNPMRVCFDVKHLYYLPQYLPVYDKLTQQRIPCDFVFYEQEDKTLQNTCEQVIREEGLKAFWFNDWDDAITFYQKEKHCWIIFGNLVSDIQHIHQFSKTALMQHGIGPKNCYYQVSKNTTTVRFVEGEHRLRRLQELFPQGNFVDTGYAKLDPAFNNTTQAACYKKMGLDPDKKTLLYAPTFYPSSIECFAKSFPREFDDYNIIIKPHFFSLTKKNYHKQKARLEQWQKYDNVYLASTGEYNLVPFMMAADVLISDASSAIFEFAALDKPVIWCDFYKLRWNYRGVFKYRLEKRMDEDMAFFHQLARQVKRYDELKSAVEKELADPLARQKERLAITTNLAGRTDGECSHRITDYLIANV